MVAILENFTNENLSSEIRTHRDLLHSYTTKTQAGRVSAKYKKWVDVADNKIKNVGFIISIAVFPIFFILGVLVSALMLTSKTQKKLSTSISIGSACSLFIGSGISHSVGSVIKKVKKLLVQRKYKKLLNTEGVQGISLEGQKITMRRFDSRVKELDRKIKEITSELNSRFEENPLGLTIALAENPNYSINSKEYYTNLDQFLNRTADLADPLELNGNYIYETDLKNTIRTLFVLGPSENRHPALLFLNKLSHCQDIYDNTVSIQSVYIKIEAILDYIICIEDVDLKQNALDRFANGGTTCPDRAVVVLEDLYLDAKLGASTNDIRCILELSIDKFKQDALRDVITSEYREAENVETYLYYLIEMKDILGINVNIGDMRFPDIARQNKTTEILSHFLTRITADTIFNSLMENPHIKRKLDAQLSSTYNDANSELYAIMDPLEDIQFSHTSTERGKAQATADTKTTLNRFKAQYLLTHLLEMGIFSQKA